MELKNLDQVCFSAKRDFLISAQFLCGLLARGDSASCRSHLMAPVALGLSQRKPVLVILWIHVCFLSLRGAAGILSLVSAAKVIELSSSS